jgi:heme/copper-type cytochrome/quinol oxidase subunit 2
MSKIALCGTVGPTGKSIANVFPSLGIPRSVGHDHGRFAAVFGSGPPGSNLIHYLCLSMLLFSALMLGENTKTGARTQDQDVQVIQMTAKQYEFSPARVHVKLGMKVRLKITALDREHGIKIAVPPEGTNSCPFAGLEFTSPQNGNAWRLKKGQETIIEFVAKTPGTYEFQCSVDCGIHHGSMKGQIVVDQ